MDPDKKSASGAVLQSRIRTQSTLGLENIGIFSKISYIFNINQLYMLKAVTVVLHYKRM